jgi:hypothetical protein
LEVFKLKKMAVKDKNYIFSTTVDSSSARDEFLIELFSYSEDEDNHTEPKKVIHSFDELISFLENLDQDKIHELSKEPLAHTN